jgi:hypothetical protein
MGNDACLWSLSPLEQVKSGIVAHVSLTRLFDMISSEKIATVGSWEQGSFHHLVSKVMTQDTIVSDSTMHLCYRSLSEITGFRESTQPTKLT